MHIEFSPAVGNKEKSNISHFTKNKLISIANGRIILNNSQLKVSRSGIEDLENFSVSEFENKLKQYFAIEIKKINL
ncbi:hypothetical protein [uncultured Aquimarina sp.]|uniref:hypothetical protein n=1 Tax=uncultured Aquimarina sp. TaxID=575652 RepID=UPI002601FACE|nr:hypothetical protein [uncultured Aquimarina sp.]